MESESSGVATREPRTLGRLPVVLTVGAAAWMLASVVMMTYGTQLNWPDYMHVNFGFPATFATHTLSTIAGSVDQWDVSISALVADLMFWLGGMAFILFAGLGYSGRRNTEGAPAGVPRVTAAPGAER